MTILLVLDRKLQAVLTSEPFLEGVDVIHLNDTLSLLAIALSSASVKIEICNEPVL